MSIFIERMIDWKEDCQILNHYTEVLYEEIYENEKDLHALQQYSRRENIQIIGIPDSISQNNLEKTVISILESMGVIV